MYSIYIYYINILYYNGVVMITGLPSSAQGYEDKVIDLNSIVVKHPAATVFMKIDSSRYVNYGIYNGDLVAVDRSLAVHPDSFVVYEDCVTGEFHIGWARNIRHEALVRGVVTHVLHTVKASGSC